MFLFFIFGPTHVCLSSGWRLSLSIVYPKSRASLCKEIKKTKKNKKTTNRFRRNKQSFSIIQPTSPSNSILLVMQLAVPPHLFGMYSAVLYTPKHPVPMWPRFIYWTGVDQRSNYIEPRRKSITTPLVVWVIFKLSKIGCCILLIM